jgi:hypothetical protein
MRRTSNSFFPDLCNSNRKLDEKTFRFGSRISKPELVNCLLSECARKVDLITEILDGRENESEIINKTIPKGDKD